MQPQVFTDLGERVTVLKVSAAGLAIAPGAALAGRGPEQGSEARAVHQALAPEDFFDVLGAFVNCIC